MPESAYLVRFEHGTVRVNRDLLFCRDVRSATRIAMLACGGVYPDRGLGNVLEAWAEPPAHRIAVVKEL